MAKLYNAPLCGGENGCCRSRLRNCLFAILLGSLADALATSMALRLGVLKREDASSKFRNPSISRSGAIAEDREVSSIVVGN